jgi:telomerase protein component 1
MKRGATVRLFVSSTFRDMHAERDHLNRFVFPELRSRCRLRSIEFLPVDLRWGITEEELEQAGAVAASIEAMGRCSYFLALIGNRFGTIYPPDTIPPEVFEEARRQRQDLVTSSYALDVNTNPTAYRLRVRHSNPARVSKLTEWLEAAGVPFAGESVTAREIQQAAFACGPRAFRCFFYLRATKVHTQPSFPAELIPAFDEPDPRARARLNTLRQRLLDEAPGVVRQYEVGYGGVRIDGTFVPSGLSATEQAAISDLTLTPQEWPEAGPILRKAISDHGTVSLSGLDQFGEQVLGDLWAQIDNDLSLDSPESSIHPSQDVAGFHERFLHERAQTFVGREDIADRILARILDPACGELIVVHGPPGSGKSSLIAQLGHRLRSDFGEIQVIPYFAGVAPGSTDLATTLRYLSQQLNASNDPQIPRELDELSVRWSHYLRDAGSQRSTVVLIDAVNQIHEPAPAGRRWLPVRAPPKTKVVVSTNDLQSIALSASEREQISIFLVPPLLEKECRAIIRAFLLKRGKKLAESQINAILNRGSETRVPLYLTVVLSELCLFGNFADLNERIHRLPDETAKLFDQVLVRLEGDFEPQLSEILLTGIALARSGLLDSELIELPDPQRALHTLQWIRFYRAIEPYTQQRDEIAGATTIRFFHEQMTRAVEARYLGTSRLRQNAHARLAKLFKQNAFHEVRNVWRREATRALSKLPHHLLGAGMREPFVATVTALDFVEAKCASGLTDNVVADYESGLACSGLLAETRHTLEELREFAVREGHPLRTFSAVPGFVRQHLYNVGPAAARLQSPAGTWFRSVRGSDEPLIAVLGQHREHINDVVLAKDSGVIVSVSLDKTLRSWDVDAWRYRSIVAVLPEGGTTCDVSHDCLTVNSGCLDGHVRIHRGQDTLICEGRFSRQPHRCRLFADDTRLLSVGISGVMIHDVESGKLLATPIVDSDVYDCSLSSAGQAALACRDGAIRIYNVWTNTITATVSLNEPVLGCAFSEDGRKLVAAGGAEIYTMGVKPYGRTCVWDTSSWQEIAGSSRKWPDWPRGARSSMRLATPLASRTAGLSSLVSISLIPQPTSRLTAGMCDLCSPLGRTDANASSQPRPTGKIWDVARLTSATYVEPGGRAIFCAFSTNSAKTFVWLSRVRGFHSAFEVAEHDFSPQSVTASEKTELKHDLVVASEIKIFGRDLAPDMPKDVANLSGWRIGSRNAHRSSPFSDWGDYWLVACSARLMDHTFHVVPQLAPEYFDSRNLTWARSVAGRIGLLRHHHVLIILPGRESEVVSRDFTHGHYRLEAQPLCQFSRDGTRLYLSYGVEVSVLEAATGSLMYSTTLGSEVVCISEAERKECLCIGCDDGELLELDWRTGRRAAYQGHDGPVTDCVYASSRHFLSIGVDGTIRMWESGIRHPRAVFWTKTSLSAFALSPVDNRVIAADIHGEVHFLVLEGLADASESVTGCSGEWPVGVGLLSSVAGNLSVALDSELANVNSFELRAVVLAYIAQIVEAVDRNAARQLRDHSRRLCRRHQGPFSDVIFGSSAEVLAAAAQVERKVFGPAEVIEQVSQVVRGLARVVKALHERDFAYATDVAKRFAWTRTRDIMLAAIYATAERSGERAAMLEIANIANVRQLPRAT